LSKVLVRSLTAEFDPDKYQDDYRVQVLDLIGRNWWEAGCGVASPGGCQSCGMGVTVQTDIGLRYTYCHNSDVFVAEGQQVTAGEQVAVSGDTGYSGAPHVHIEFHLDGVQYCPQP
jgi:murein DD-endopeptidase MepM/ murein hydrolase activator NlpD